MTEVFAFALYFQSIVSCIDYYATWNILRGDFKQIIHTIPNISVQTQFAFEIKKPDFFVDDKMIEEWQGNSIAWF